MQSACLLRYNVLSRLNSSILTSERGLIRMNIGLLHYSVPPVVGGVESVLAHQARLLTADGHRVRVIAARGEAWAAQIEFTHLPLADSLHPRVLSLKAVLDTGLVPAEFAALVDELCLYLNKAAAGLDVLIAHNVCSLNKNLALTAALHRLNSSSGFPRLILWHHDLAWTTLRYQAELHAGYPWDLLRTAWPGVTQVVVSDLRQTELATLFSVPLDRVHVVPNGVDLAIFFKLEEQTKVIIQRLKLFNAAPLLLLPVRITPRKNLELALHILFHLRLSHPSAVLLVTGPLGAHNPSNDDYFAQLLRLRAELGLQNNAHFLAELSDEYLPDALIADFFRLADALVLPSREEGFGIPIIEAALSRLPVFCTDIAPLRALVRQDANTFSPDADPLLVATQISSWMQSDPVYRFALRTRQRYTWEQVYRERIAPLLVAPSLKEA